MMKKLLYLLALTVVFSCNNSSDDEPVIEDSVEEVPMTYLWQSTLNDSTGNLEMKKDKPSGIDSLEASQVIGFLNDNNPNVQLKYNRISGDTIYVEIPDATYLTQQMGSTGPMMYFAAAVYNLTEIPGVNFVRFDFEEGDHASPGVFDRKRFEGF